MRLPRLAFRMAMPDRPLLTGVAIGALAGVLAVGAVTAASPAASPVAAPAAAQMGQLAPGASLAPVKPGDPGFRLQALRTLVRRNWRVDVSVTGQDGVHFGTLVRGTVAVGTDSIIVTLPDNPTQVFAVIDATLVRKAGETVPFPTVRNDDHALVLGSKNDDGSYTARVIRLLEESTTP